MGQRAWVGGRLLPPSPASLCTGHGQHRIPNTCQFMPWFLWPHAPVNMSLHVCGRSHGSLPLPPKIPQNNLDELWALFDLACGEALLGDRRHFHSHFGEHPGAASGRRRKLPSAGPHHALLPASGEGGGVRGALGREGAAPQERASAQ